MEDTATGARLWFLLLLLTVLVCLAASARAAAPDERAFAAARGVVESVDYELDQRLLHIRGWSLDTATSEPPSTFAVQIDGREARVVQQIFAARDDVGASLPGTDARRAGYELQVAVPADLSWRKHDVTVTARWGQGSVELAATTARAGSFSGAPIPARHWWIAVLVGVFAIGHALASRFAPQVQTNVAARCEAFVQRNTYRITWALAALFLVLVGTGATGLSLQWMVGDAQHADGQPFLSPDSGMHPLALAPRAIRSDEWLVITPSALAQVRHDPPFPVVNHRLGTDGQNMMVIGMTGVPVWHLSSLAKPATLGFFLLPLRNALAWYWFFPVFACLLAMWGFLNRLAADRRCRNLGLSLAFCAAPYAAGWSHWPLYATFFAAAALWGVLKMATASSARTVWALAGPMALCIAGFALVLYPPWQIPLATFCCLLLAGWWADRRPSPVHGFWPAMILAVVLALAVLSVWWIDAREAISTMQSTVYPGGRKALHGGEFPLYWGTRGYSNTDTLSFLGASEVNASEFGGYFMLPFAWALLGWQLARARIHGLRWQALAWCAFAAWAALFIVTGVPPWLAKSVLWHVVPSHRVDLALAFACTVLVCLVPAPAQVGPAPAQRTSVIAAWATALLSGALVAAGLLGLPAVLYPSLSPVLLAAMALAGCCIAYWLVRGRMGAALGLTLALYVCATAPFNPVSFGPDRIELHPAIRPYLQYAGTNGETSPRRTLTVGLDDGMRAAMSLAAAGVPVVNGVFYYPQFSLWHRLGLAAHDLPTINRYQHLLFDIGVPGAARPYRVSTRSEMSDVVTVTIDATRFDFSATGAEVVLTKETNILAMSGNPQLRLQGIHAGWAWFAVSNP